MPIGTSVVPNDRYMQWAWIWRKQVWLGENWSIAGEKKFNHVFFSFSLLLCFSILELSFLSIKSIWWLVLMYLPCIIHNSNLSEFNRCTWEISLSNSDWSMAVSPVLPRIAGSQKLTYSSHFTMFPAQNCASYQGSVMGRAWNTLETIARNGERSCSHASRNQYYQIAPKRR